MKNYVQSDDTVTVPAPYDVSSGGGCLVGHLFGVAMSDALSGADVVLRTEDVYDLTKHAADTPAVGDQIYWDNTDKYATTAATSGYFLIGVAVKAAAGGDPTVRVRLNGVSVVALA